MPINLPKTVIAIIKSGGTYPVNPNSLLETFCRGDYLVPVATPQQGWARHKAYRGDLISNISFPVSDISDTDVNLIVEELNNNYYKMFNTEIVTSFSALWSSNAQKKIIVFLCDKSFFTHSLEYNSLLTNVLWQAKSQIHQIKDGDGNEMMGNGTALGIYLSEPGDSQINGADLVLAFTNDIAWGGRVWLPNPDSTQSNPLMDIAYQNISQNNNYHWTGIARTIAHEVGHSLGLLHHGLGNENDIDNYEEYYFGNEVWVPIMGGEADGTRLYQWNDGSYDGASKPWQKDIDVISKNAGLLKLKDQSILGTEGPGKSTPDYPENDNKIISRRAKLVSTLDIKETQSVKTIEGMIGYPLDTDVLKIVLKAGDYEIGAFRHDDPSILMMNLGLKILKSKIEVSKQSDQQNKRRIPQESLPENYYCQDAFLPEKYPSDSKEEPVALSLPEEVHVSRQPLAENDSSVYTCSQPNQFDTNRDIDSINLPTTCLIYLRAYGDEMTQIKTTGFPRYGSLGTYRITIRKDGNNFNLDQILPKQTPPNCYATPKLWTRRNDSAEEKIFFTQDPSDFSKNPSYDESSDYPNSKKFNIVVNGKIVKIPMLLQGKMYGTGETIDDESKKEFYFVKSTTTPFENKKQEFIMAPPWDYA